MPDFVRTHKRAAASVALIAGVAAGPLAGTATAASAHPGTDSPASTALNGVTGGSVATGGSAATGGAPSAGQLLPEGAPAAFTQSSLDLDSAQIDNAHTIVAASNALHLPPRAAVIAVATSMQESKLENLGNLGADNDHDSLGLFQQRPSAGWGTPAELTNPTYAATAFLNALTQVPNWQNLPLTDAAQAVQDSAFGDRYAQWEQQATNLVLSYYHIGAYANDG
ncbi:hypothetical protein [Rugosimonospora acidiphila]|uniref:hypothetical protein n=1 Tax=Rugosimonospora acidiphila TaxID=556531 RepID=UPI003CD06841